MIWFIGFLVVLMLAYVGYVQWTKTPGEDAIPKRAVAALTGAAGFFGYLVKLIFQGSVP